MPTPSREEMLKQMYGTLNTTKNPEYLTEVAMPTVYQPVDRKDTDLSKNSSDN